MGLSLCQAMAERMLKDPREYTLTEIYQGVCRDPRPDVSVKEMHARCSNAIGRIRNNYLKPQGYVLVFGEARHSYKVAKRERKVT